MEISNLIPHIEALVFASDKPLTLLELTELVNNAFGFMEDKITLDQIESAMEGIVEKYRSEFYPFEVRESGGGWQFLTKRDYHKTVAQLNGEKFLKRLSSAAMETLAIIAYKQPVTKAEIEAIRGVSSDYAVQKLLEKELIVITGRNESLPGHPLVYATSKNFMDYFGINSPEDLPKLKEVFDDSLATATSMGSASGETDGFGEATENQEDDDAHNLVVSETGELIEEALEIDAELPTEAEETNAGADENLLEEENEDQPIEMEAAEEETFTESIDEEEEEGEDEPEDDEEDNDEEENAEENEIDEDHEEEEEEDQIEEEEDEDDGDTEDDEEENNEEEDEMDENNEEEEEDSESDNKD